MIRRPPRSTRTDTLFPYTTLFRSALRRLMLTDTLNPIGSRFTVGRYLPHMEKTLGFKIEAAKLAKIDALAQTRGGRGPFMRPIGRAACRESVSTCRSRWSPYHSTKKTKNIIKSFERRINHKH